jgi:hypothetical protein
MPQAAQNVSTDFALTNQLVRALRALDSHQNDEEFSAAYDLVGDLVTALSRTESVSAHAALARAAALICDLDLLKSSLPKKLFDKCYFQQTWNRMLRLAWQSLFFLEEEFGTTAEASGLDYFAPMESAKELFPDMDRLAAVELAEAA